MATSSIFTNIVINDPKKAEKFIVHLKHPAMILHGSRLRQLNRR